MNGSQIEYTSLPTVLQPGMIQDTEALEVPYERRVEIRKAPITKVLVISPSLLLTALNSSPYEWFAD